jgi:DNA-binding HxlR family transcriptional regulator
MCYQVSKRIPAVEGDKAMSMADGGALPCVSRTILDQIADKWSILVLAALCEKPLRFNELRRRLDGVTQKALTQCLRRLERNGIVARRVISGSPVAVEYSVTPLGTSLKEPFAALHRWTMQHGAEIEHARAVFDGRENQAAVAA